MKLLLLLFAIGLMCIAIHAPNAATPFKDHTQYVAATDSVFVCDSRTSYEYHSSPDCRGLNRCTHTIIKVSRKEAVETYGKRACKICY